MPDGTLDASDKIRLDAEGSLRTSILQYFAGVAFLVA